MLRVSNGCEISRRDREHGDLVPVRNWVFAPNTVTIVDCRVDYAEKMTLTHKWQKLKSPV